MAAKALILEGEPAQSPQRPEGWDGDELSYPAGILARLSSTTVTLPVRKYSMTFSAIDLPTPGISAHTRDLLQTRDVEVGDIGGMAADRAGGLFVGARLERLASGDGDEIRVLLKERFDLLVGPDHVSQSRNRPVRRAG
ncbi:hypothetical protein SHIRM173S_06109 [Streptomyces hirsutus]